MKKFGYVLSLVAAMGFAIYGAASIKKSESFASNANQFQVAKDDNGFGNL
jgi:hypothetical protein